MSLDASSLFNVKGLVAFITGGGSGIGLMMAKALIQNGAERVYIAGRRLEVLQEAAASLGPNAIPIRCDSTSKEEINQAVETVKNDVGYLNLLICNAGMFGPDGGKVDATTTLEGFVAHNMAFDFDTYMQPFAVNVAAVWFTAIAFLPLLDAANKKGNLEQTAQIVVTSSVGAFNKKPPGGYAYSQSKAAVVALVKQLSTILLQWKIRTNSICPGFFPSEMAAPILDRFKQEDGTFGPVPTDFIPVGRLGDEQDAGGTILYLASRAAGYCNGVIINIDGGRLTFFPSTW